VRIALVSREFLPFWGAGIGAYAASMARAWSRAHDAQGRPHEVVVLTADHPGLMTHAPKAFPGVSFHVPGPLKGEADRAACRWPMHTRSMAVFRTLDQLHADKPFDYIEMPDYFAEGYFTLRAARGLGKFRGAVLGVRLHTPTARCRELNLESRPDDQVTTLEHMEAQAIRDADVLNSPTRSLLDWVEDHIDVPSGQARVVTPYPFELSMLDETAIGNPAASASPSTLTKLPGQDLPPAPPGIATVLYFGRLERRKGVEHLVDAGRRLVDTGVPVRLVFVGGDTQTGPSQTSMLNHLRSRVMNMKADRFIFMPAMPRPALVPLIKSATLVCLPSLWENFPNACVEAMALGACVVASDQGGMGEIITDGEHGLLFPGGNATILGEVLKRALADEPMRQRCQLGAPARIQALCDPATVVTQMASAIRQGQPSMRARQAHFEKHLPEIESLEVPIIQAHASSRGLRGLLGQLRRTIGRSYSRPRHPPL
jgi:glycosyltransferase involved in cell wall biosynthesis